MIPVVFRNDEVHDLITNGTVIVKRLAQECPWPEVKLGSTIRRAGFKEPIAKVVSLVQRQGDWWLEVERCK